LAIKNRTSKGNLVSKYPIFRVYHKEAGESTLGGRKIWLDSTIGKLNLDNQGEFLGSFNTGELILVIYKDGNYELNPIDFSKRYNMKDIVLIEKYDSNKICSILYKSAESRDFYIKRFKIETSTTEKRFSLVQDIMHSKIMIGTTNIYQSVKFNYVTKKGEKKNKVLSLDDFVGVKNWKAIGNKLIGYNRLSAFEIIDSGEIEDKDDSDKPIELTLF